MEQLCFNLTILEDSPKQLEDPRKAPTHGMNYRGLNIAHFFKIRTERILWLKVRFHLLEL